MKVWKERLCNVCKFAPHNAMLGGPNVLLCQSYSIILYHIMSYHLISCHIMSYLNIALTELSTFWVSMSISPVLLSARKISKASLADIVLAGISQMPCMAEKARGNGQRWWHSPYSLVPLVGGSYGGRGQVSCELVGEFWGQKNIQISPNQKTVGFKHEDTLWWHPIYSLGYLSDNRCGCHLDDVVPKEFVVCSLQERLWGVFSRGSRDGHVNDRGVALKELGISIVYLVQYMISWWEVSGSDLVKGGWMRMICTFLRGWYVYRYI